MLSHGLHQTVPVLRNHSSLDLVDPILRVVRPLTVRTIETIGLEHVDTSQPSLLVGNHPTWIDGFVMRELYQKLTMQASCIVNATLLNLKITQAYYERQNALGVISHPQDTTQRQHNTDTIHQAAERIVQGSHISIFATG